MVSEGKTPGQHTPSPALTERYICDHATRDSRCPTPILAPVRHERIPELDELPDELALDAPAPEPSGEASDRVNRILAGLPANYRRVLELRFLRGYSLREVAAEVGSTVGGVKVMQLRALRAAAKVSDSA